MTAMVHHPVFGCEVSCRRCVELQARLPAARMLGELPSYQPAVTR